MTIQKVKVKFRYFVGSLSPSTTGQVLQNTESEITQKKTPVTSGAEQKCDSHAARACYELNQINMHLGN